ncbi:MAG: MFS transporter [Gammaproteobacteria bacterium]|nr:MFS transporter [Gammaproteobacteria bacterium]
MADPGPAAGHRPAAAARAPQPAALPGEGSTAFLRSRSLTRENGLFRRVALIELVITGGEQFRNTLSLFFMQDAIGLTRPGILYVLYFVSGLLAMPVWDLLARRYGKHRSLASAMVLVSIVSLAIFGLDHGDVAAFRVLFAIKGFCFGAFAYLPLAMMADVVDMDTLRSGDQRTGTLLRRARLHDQCAASFGGLSCRCWRWPGTAASGGAVNGPDALYWLAVLYAIVPTVLFVFAFWLAWSWPLTPERHARIRSALERRAERLAARGP